MISPRLMLRLVVLLLVASALGAGGWYAWTLRQEQQTTVRQLQETQASFQRTQETLQATEAERGELLLAYDELKGRVAITDEELVRLKHASAQMTVQMTALTNDRAMLTQQVEEMAQEAEQLGAQLDTLEADTASAEAENAALERRLKDVTATSLSPEEGRQLIQAAARSQDQAQRLSEQMAVLSRAYEQLAQAAPAASRASSTAAAPAARQRKESAARYRRLGDACLAAYQYPKAAEAYEQALRFQEDPDTHAKLAFLYSRLLHDPQRAQQHLALAGGQAPSSSALAGTPGAQGLPRKSWRLLGNWLTQ